MSVQDAGAAPQAATQPDTPKKPVDKLLPTEPAALYAIVVGAASRISLFREKCFRDPDRPSPMKEWRYAVVLVLEYKGLDTGQIAELLCREGQNIRDMRIHARDHFYDRSMRTHEHAKKLCACPEIGIAFPNFEVFLKKKFKTPGK